MLFQYSPCNAQPDFILVFMSRMFMHRFVDLAKDNPSVLREMLFEDRILEFMPGNAVFVLTTWKWDPKKQEASFWMREDVLAGMQSGMFDPAIWRTDNRRMESGFVTCEPRRNLTIGRRLSDGKGSGATALDAGAG